jgi:hypothetical protein
MIYGSGDASAMVTGAVGGNTCGANIIVVLTVAFVKHQRRLAIPLSAGVLTVHVVAVAATTSA